MGCYDDMVIFQCKEEPCIRHVEFMNDHYNMIQEIIDKLIDGKKLYIFYPYADAKRKANSRNDEVTRAGIREMCDFLMAKTGKVGQYYRGGMDDAIEGELGDVNTHWLKYDFVVVNNKVTVGLSFDLEYFDGVYMIIGDFNHPRDIAQSSLRVRNLTSNTIKIAYFGSLKPRVAWSNDCAKMGCESYTKVYQSTMVEQMAPTRPTLQLFFKKANFTLATDSNEEKMARDLAKAIDTELGGFFSTVPFDKIPAIIPSYTKTEPTEVKELNNRIIGQCATMLDKMTLQKYFFVKKFDKLVWPLEPVERIAHDPRDANYITYSMLNCMPYEMALQKWIGYTSDERAARWPYITEERQEQFNASIQEAFDEDMAMLARIWSQRLVPAATQVSKLLNDPNHLINQIATAHGHDLFPTDDEVPKMKVSPEMKHLLLRSFDFKRKGTGAIGQLIVAAYNEFFGVTIIDSIFDKTTRASTYTVRPFANEMYRFCKRKMSVFTAHVPSHNHPRGVCHMRLDLPMNKPSVPSAVL